jgi:hypothetical protein
LLLIAISKEEVTKVTRAAHSFSHIALFFFEREKSRKNHHFRHFDHQHKHTWLRVDRRIECLAIRAPGKIVHIRQFVLQKVLPAAALMASFRTDSLPADEP